MMKRLLMTLALVFLVTLVTCCSACGGQRRESRSVVISDIRRETVALMTIDSDGDHAPTCTGVWVGPTTIVTAHHCVEFLWEKSVIEGNLGDIRPLVGMEVMYTTEDNVVGMYKVPTAEFVSTVLDADPDSDLALLTTAGHDSPEHPFAVLAKRDVMQGDPVHIVGHVIGVYWTYTTGIVAGVRPDKWLYQTSVSGPLVQISSPTFFGNSGGGAFNEEGELVGICSFLTRAPHTAYFVHRDSVERLMKRNDLITVSEP